MAALILVFLSEHCCMSILFLKFLPKERAHGDSSVQFSKIPAPTVPHHRVPTRSCHKDTLDPNLFLAHQFSPFLEGGGGGGGFKMCSCLPRIFSLCSRQIDVLNDVGGIPLPKLLVKGLLPATQRTNQLYCYTDTYTTTNQLCCYTDTYTTTNQLYCYTDTYATTNQLCRYTHAFTTTNQLYCNITYTQQPVSFTITLYTYATTNQLYCTPTQQPVSCTVHVHSNHSAVTAHLHSIQTNKQAI